MREDMAGTVALQRAHDIAVELQNAAEELWRLSGHLWSGMQPDDPRLDELNRLRGRLRKGLEEAEAELLPQLPEFAWVHEWPVELNGVTASSAHQATVKLAAWLVDRKWSADVFRRYYERFYDEEKDQLDWDAVRAAKDRSDDDLYDFWCTEDWTEHAALLEMEYAKARKLAVSPGADIPKLAEIETCVLEALGGEDMTADEITRKAGYPNNSNFRTRLRRMVEKELLEKLEPHGYRRGSLTPPI